MKERRGDGIGEKRGQRGEREWKVGKWRARKWRGSKRRGEKSRRGERRTFVLQR